MARDVAEKMRDEGKGIILDQFANPDNPLAHYEGTGPEIWRDTDGKVTHFVSSMGTTGTIMGTSRFLKEQNPAIQIVGCQPEEGSQIPGIRKWPEAYLPKIYDKTNVDRIEYVGQADAEEMTRRLATEEGIFAGISSGGALAVALRLSLQLENAVIVSIICDRGDRYLFNGRFPGMKPVLVFDIETIPDVAGLRRLNDLPAGLSDDEVAELAFQQRRAQTGNDFLQLHLQRVVTISCVLRTSEGLKVWSLSEPDLNEGAIIQRFFDGIEKFTPQLVSWNGGGFDLPVLHYRGMLHGVAAPRYWDLGEGDYADSRDFKWNNYISRYHTAPPRPDGSAGALQRPRQRAARRPGQAVRLSRQARHGWRQGLGGLAGRQGRGDSRLLRNRRHQYLPGLQPLPPDARRTDGGRRGCRGRIRQGATCPDRRAALARVSRRLGLTAPAPAV